MQFRRETDDDDKICEAKWMPHRGIHAGCGQYLGPLSASAAGGGCVRGVPHNDHPQDQTRKRNGHGTHLPKFIDRMTMAEITGGGEANEEKRQQDQPEINTVPEQP